MATDLSRLRNFCIITHIDKEVLADRMLDLTHAVSERNMRAQYLDKMDLGASATSPSRPRRSGSPTPPPTVASTSST